MKSNFSRFCKFYVENIFF